MYHKTKIRFLNNILEIPKPFEQKDIENFITSNVITGGSEIPVQRNT